MTIFFCNFYLYHDSWRHLQTQLDDKAVLHLKIVEHESEEFLGCFGGQVVIEEGGESEWRKQHQQHHILLMPVPNFEGGGISL